MPEHAYTDADNEIAKSWTRTHANGEQTHVYLLATDATHYVAVAADVDPREYDGVAGTVIEFTSSLEAACDAAQHWMAANPKGIAGASDDGPGWLARLWGALQKLDQSATPEEDQA